MNILVRQLPRRLTENDIKELFEPFGAISALTLVMDQKTKSSKGFGFVEMDDDKEANKAIKALNGKTIDGMKIRVKEAEER